MVYSIYSIYINIIIYIYLYLFILFYLFVSFLSVMLGRQVSSVTNQNICMSVHRVGPIRKKSITIFKTFSDFSKIYYKFFQKGLTI